MSTGGLRFQLLQQMQAMNRRGPSLDDAPLTQVVIER